MERVDRPDPERLKASIEACVQNGIRLLEDADLIRHHEPTALLLAMIAQEEFAKAFILSLVRKDVIPWSPLLLRATNDHACKHLIGVIIEYADPEWEELEELQAIYRDEYELGDKMPLRVASAIEILRYEKIERWASKTWFWAEDPDYDQDVVRISEGARDKIKQNALYVRVGRDGSLASTPQVVTPEDAEREMKKAERYRWSVRSLAADDHSSSIMFDKVRDALKRLFNQGE
jgi:AbiV family abortive infection protein